MNILVEYYSCNDINVNSWNCNFTNQTCKIRIHGKLLFAMISVWCTKETRAYWLYYL